ncbi:MAG: hypothetical protein ACYDAK_08535 [Candidatus Limnocylindrales bacterium]
MELTTQAALREYDALRAEVMSLQLRTHQLLGVTIAGAGAVLTLSASWIDKPTQLELLLLGAAALLGLVAVTFFGHANKQMEIGLYLRKLAIELRLALQDLDPDYSESDASRLLAWEDRSVGSLSVSGGVVSKPLWFADAMQLFELVALGLVPLALLIAGWFVYSNHATPKSDVATAMVFADLLVLVIVGAAVFLSIWFGRQRDLEAKKDAVLAHYVQWDGGAWAGVRRLTKSMDSPGGAEFVDQWVKGGGPPAAATLAGGTYLRMDRTSGDRMWRYEWRAGVSSVDGA